MRTNICTATALLTTALLAAGASALPTTQPSVAGSAPATRPSENISVWIQELGADDYHTRRDAGQKLKQLGKAAIPALKEARQAKDPEIQARADELLQEIQEPPVVADAVPQGTGAPGAHSMGMTFNNGVKTVDIHETGRTIHIEQSPAGIKMKVTGQLDGKEVTRDYSAPTAEKLQKQNPKAYALYAQYGGGGPFGVGGIRIQGGNGIGVNNIQIRVNNNVVVGPGAAPNIAPLPDGLLGINAGQAAAPDQGVAVLHLIPGSRAAKLGIKENDIIQKLNGVQIRSIADLQKIMADKPKELAIEGLREGKPFKLTEEKKPDAAEPKNN